MTANDWLACVCRQPQPGPVAVLGELSLTPNPFKTKLESPSGGYSPTTVTVNFSARANMLHRG